MLVLSRRINESVVIGNTGTFVIDKPCTITVVDIRFDKVRLGFEFPKEVPVHRKELYNAIYGQSTTDPSVN